MNPVLQDILGFLHDRRQFTEFRQDKTEDVRRRVVFVFADGSSEVREYECDLPTFMEWWKQATSYLWASAEAAQRVAESL